MLKHIINQGTLFFKGIELRILCLLLVVSCTTVIRAFADDRLRIVAEEISIPNMEINDIAKDSAGRMWLATNNGMLMYDGYQPIALPALSGKAYSKIFGVIGNHILVVNETGIWDVDGNNLTAKQKANFSSGVQITASCLDAAHAGILFGLSNGAIYKLANNKTPELITKTTLPIFELTATGSAVYFTHKDQLYEYSYKNSAVTKVNLGENTGRIIGAWNAGDQLVLGSWMAGATIYKIPGVVSQTSSELKFINSQNRRLSAAAISDSAAFIAYENYSFYRYDCRNGSVEDIAEKHADVFYGKMVKCIFADGEVTWIGTDKGIIKLTSFQKKFTNLLNDHRPMVSTRTIIKDGDKIFVASYAGIFFTDKSTDWINLNPGFKISQNAFPYVMHRVGHEIFFGFETPAVFVLDENAKTLEKIPIGNYSRNSSAYGIYAMTQCSPGEILLGGTVGVFNLNPTTKKLTRYTERYFDVSGNTIRNFFYDSSKSVVYTATKNGLYLFSKDGALIKKFDTTNTNGLKSASFMFVTKSPDGNIWAATRGDGIYIFSENLIVKHLTIEDGLSDNIVYGFMFDENKAWISTYNGLSSYDLKEQRFYNYYTNDGLSANEFNHNSMMSDDSGYFYFGGINGINQFKPGSLAQKNKPFYLFISGVRKWRNDNYQVIPFDGKQEITKLSSEYSMSVMLGISDYAQLQKTSYYYQIDGVTNSWVPLPANTNLLNVERLSYGSYNVHVKAVNYRGEQSANMLSFQLHLLAPFYYRWWFITLMIAVAIGIYYLLTKYKIMQEKKLQTLRIKIASDLHDEVGSMLTGIGMYSQNLASRKDINEQALKRAQKISSLSRQAISSMRDILWTVDARNDSVHALEDQIRNFVDEILTPKDIRITTVFETDNIKKNLPGDMRQQLYFFTKEAINNIARHSQAKNVQIIFKQKGKSFHFFISNDGVTPGKTTDSGGQGLKNMQLRSDRLQASFHYKSEQDTFCVTISKDYPFM